jgi:hypothetical protein
MTRDDLGCAGLRAELESRVALGCASAPVRLLGVSLVGGCLTLLVSDTSSKRGCRWSRSSRLRERFGMHPERPLVRSISEWWFFGSRVHG